ncbi:response regulator receiver domain-containing protein [Chitinophaga niastensis]|uniref:Response regulator receiver domain-containing protein n=1 Tax=Chitinophaga niastensis TaxID=536980 RepID=A0A2P8HQ69_CHINA|nr:response regulator [Chitinophaga niastensis]PSL48352.1 response regulator receiver domain-containing protein [Chitinophaga niastensis]
MKKKLTCLLIDADRDRRNQFYLALDLLQISKACVCQDDTDKALDYFKKQPAFTPDYIFLDILQPQQEGVLFLRKLRKIKRFQQTPVIWYSKSYDVQQAPALRETGFAAGVTKHGDLYHLKENLRSLFHSEPAVAVAPEEVSAATRFKQAFVFPLSAQIIGRIWYFTRELT